MFLLEIFYGKLCTFIRCIKMSFGDYLCNTCNVYKLLAQSNVNFLKYPWTFQVSFVKILKLFEIFKCIVKGHMFNKFLVIPQTKYCPQLVSAM